MNKAHLVPGSKDLSDTNRVLPKGHGSNLKKLPNGLRWGNLDIMTITVETSDILKKQTNKPKLEFIMTLSPI